MHLLIIMQKFNSPNFFLSMEMCFYRIIQHNFMAKFLFKIILLTLTYTLSVCFYSSTYRKCHVPIRKNNVINNLGDMQIERVGVMRKYPEMQPIMNHRLPLKYVENSSFIYHQYLGAGASGQVYIIEHEFYSPNSPNKITIEPKVVKRFFHEEIKNFEQENYIMNKLGQPVQWMRQFGTYRMPAKEQQVFQGQHRNQYATMALYPFKNSKELYQVDPDKFNIPILLYKLAQKIHKAHSLGIIHNDIKLANILVTIDNPMIPELFDVKLIDWNLASFYYPGYQSIAMKGTPCYLSPQQLFGTKHITPATDVWTLGLTIYYFLAETKPFKVKCSQLSDNLQAIGSLVGLQAIQKILQKYRFDSRGIAAKNMQIMRNHPINFTKSHLEDFIPEQKKNRFNNDLLDLLKGMIHPDLEQRLTIEEVLNHPYFNNVRSLPPMFYARNKKQGMMTHEMFGDWEGYNYYPNYQNFNAQKQHQGDQHSQKIQHGFELKKYKGDVQLDQAKLNHTKETDKKVKPKVIVHKKIKIRHEQVDDQVAKHKQEQKQKQINKLQQNRKKNNFDRMIQKKHQEADINPKLQIAPIQNNQKARQFGLANKKQQENQKLIHKQIKVVGVANKRKAKIPKHKKAIHKPENKKLRIS